MSDAQLRAELRRLGHNPGPITPDTRSLYLKKLAKLRASVAADVNGYGQPAVADGGGARRRRPAPAREPEPEPIDDSEPMDEVDAIDETDRMDESESGGLELEDSLSAAVRSPAELGFGAPATSRYDSPSAGYRPAGRSPMTDLDPPRPATDWSYRRDCSSLFGGDPALTPASRDSPFREVPGPTPAPTARSSLYRDDPAPISRGSVPPEDPLEAVRSRYRPEPLGRTRQYPGSQLYSRGTGTLLSERRPAPAAVSDWRADSSPVTRAEPPPAERPGSLRQRVAAWCRPAPPAAAADYDTCSDSEPEEAEEPPPPPPPSLTPSQQLQAFRRRMAAGGSSAVLSERSQAGFQAPPAPAHGASHVVPYCILLVAVLFFGALGLSYLRLARTDETGAGTQLDSAAADSSSAGELSYWLVSVHRRTLMGFQSPVRSHCIVIIRFNDCFGSLCRQ